MEKFTYQQATEAAEEGAPILVTPRWVKKVVKNHHADFSEFIADKGEKTSYDACDVFAWLGY